HEKRYERRSILLWKFRKVQGKKNKKAGIEIIPAKNRRVRGGSTRGRTAKEETVYLVRGSLEKFFAVASG
ncbi:MAG TPA: hypothetical protein VES89_11110, partial [Candidatus Competibacteraceae bacterium]|nr:hypothetical protein [Candidatus Competibacteraceae bacterium]